MISIPLAALVAVVTFLFGVFFSGLCHVAGQSSACDDCRLAVENAKLRGHGEE